MKQLLHVAAACALGVALNCRLASGAEIMLTGIDGPVTPQEIESFKAFMKTAEIPTNNHHNALVYGSGGAAAEALGIVYELSHDPELLDQLVDVSDKILAARNDPDHGRVLWTGKRELTWPNKDEGAPDAGSTGTENGDVVGHMLYAAQLILQDKRLWDKPVAIGDSRGYGKTYLERAKTYVREADRTTDTFIVPWLVQKNSNRYYFPRSELYPRAEGKPVPTHDQPVPWNQQMMLNNGLMRLAACHDLLKDDPGRVKQYDAIVQASVDWFMGSLTTYQVDGHDCYKWTYVLEDPPRHIEDTAHGGYDMLVFRAYDTHRYGLTADALMPFANTLQYVIYKGADGFAARTDGANEIRKTIGATWLALADVSPAIYPLVAKADLPDSRTKPLVAAMIMRARSRVAAAEGAHTQ